jgi:hypothetical protein
VGPREVQQQDNLHIPNSAPNNAAAQFRKAWQISLKCLWLSFGAQRKSKICMLSFITMGLFTYQNWAFYWPKLLAIQIRRGPLPKFPAQ